MNQIMAYFFQFRKITDVARALGTVYSSSSIISVLFQITIRLHSSRLGLGQVLHVSQFSAKVVTKERY